MSSDLRDRPSRPSTDTAPHPRIRARRVAVARDVGRLRRRRLNVALALVCAAVWTMVGLRSSLLDVDRVQVDGARRTPEATVVAATDIALGRAMTSVDRSAATASVAALPWVDDVRVERIWPGTVRVVVTERTPAVVVDAPGGAVLADRDGRVLAEAGPDDEVVRLEGSRDVGPGDVLPATDRTVLAVVGEIPPSLGALTDSARTGDQGVTLGLAGGWSVLVGDESDLATKATAALTVQHAADPADGCVIDVRVPGAPVLTGGGTCA